MMPAAVPRQAQLPLRMAAAVVAQGIKIRLGRSLVTITGIVLGIAFLVSILGSQALRRGVAAEDRLREEANRQYGYLVAETGGLAHRTVALLLTSPPSPTEVRLLQRLEREKPAAMPVWSKARALPPGAACLLVLGNGPVPELDLQGVVAGLEHPVVAVSVEPHEPRLQAADINLVRLGRPLPPEERARLKQSLEREHFRGLWIIVISLLVTVIGISNAMLMSVTERFRDIGTMKCLGATSRFIRQIFLLEASFMGLVGGAMGVVLGLLVSIGTYLVLYDASLVLHTLDAEAAAIARAGALALLAAVALSVVAALYPAQFAAKMVPADALRSNV
jgi:putative ABC transport system permease protein